MSRAPFVKRVHTEGPLRDQREDLNAPTWGQVEERLKRLGLDGPARMDSFSEDETVAMTVHGEGEAFHIVIGVAEEKYFYYWNGAPPSDELRELAGHYFNVNQICSDRARLMAILRTFWETGERLVTGVQWIEEDLSEHASDVTSDGSR